MALNGAILYLEVCICAVTITRPECVTGSLYYVNRQASYFLQWQRTNPHDNAPKELRLKSEEKKKKKKKRKKGSIYKY